MNLALTSKNLRLILQILLGLSVLLFIALMFVGLSVLSAKSREVVDLKLKDRTAEAQLSALKVAKAEIQTYAYFKDIAKKVIPSDKDQDQAVVEIFTLANESGLDISEITFPPSELGGTSGAATASPNSAPSTSSQSTPAPSGGTSKSAISQAKPVEGISGLYSLKINIDPDAIGPTLPYSRFITFLQKLENNRRTAQITKVDIDPGEPEYSGPELINFTLELNIFIKP